MTKLRFDCFDIGGSWVTTTLFRMHRFAFERGNRFL